MDVLYFSYERNELGQKYCNTCNCWKDVSEFGNKAKAKDGLNSQCKTCVKAYQERSKNRIRVYEETHREQHIEYMKNYHAVRRAKRQAEEQAYYEAHKEEIEKQKQLKEQKAREKKLKYAQEHREEAKQRAKKYYWEHLEKYRAYEQTEARKQSRRLRDKERDSNIQRKISKTVSQGMRHSLKSDKAGRHWEDLVPYTLQDLRQHLESQFTPEMSWSNYGTYWEIDHIIPQNVFSTTSPDDSDFKICWSLANLRPLEKSLNRQRPKDGSDISEELKQKILCQFKIREIN